jgi:ADYC domain-containing protein
LRPEPIEAQGISMQGISMQGISMQGISMQGISMQGITLGGVGVEDVRLNGTILQGKRHGVLLNGADFVGAIVGAVLSNGVHTSLRIDSVEEAADPDIYYYGVSYFNTGWKSICGVAHDGTPIKAIPLLGTWDASQGTPAGGSYIDDPEVITFGCRTGVLAKCVELGYKPWQTVEECAGSRCDDVPMRHLHQACTRMMRADLCGDGTPHTVDGTHINLWDAHGIQSEDLSVSWPLEAEWTARGAKCMEHVRLTTDGAAGARATQRYVDEKCPEIQSSAALSTCGEPTSTFWPSVGSGTPIADRVLLRDESVAPPADP